MTYVSVAGLAPVERIDPSGCLTRVEPSFEVTVSGSTTLQISASVRLFSHSATVRSSSASTSNFRSARSVFFHSNSWRRRLSAGSSSKGRFARSTPEKQDCSA
jgi:hypothetical protein